MVGYQNLIAKLETVTPYKILAHYAVKVTAHVVANIASLKFRTGEFQVSADLIAANLMFRLDLSQQWHPLSTKLFMFG